MVSVPNSECARRIDISAFPGSKCFTVIIWRFSPFLVDWVPAVLPVVWKKSVKRFSANNLHLLQYDCPPLPLTHSPNPREWYKFDCLVFSINRRGANSCNHLHIKLLPRKKVFPVNTFPSITINHQRQKNGPTNYYTITAISFKSDVCRNCRIILVLNVASISNYSSAALGRANLRALHFNIDSIQVHEIAHVQ